MKLTNFLDQIKISHVMFISIILHVIVISQPPEQIGDESVFLTIFRMLQQGIDNTPYQLPGLSFLLFPAVELFGDYWFSWRITSLTFGMLFLFVFYHTIKKITTERNAILAVVIVSIDITIFVHSSLFLRDVPMLFFGTFAIYLFLNKKYYACAVVLGAAALIKETAIFFLLFLIAYQIITTKPWKNIRNINYKQALIFGLILSGCFLIPLWIYDIIVEPKVYDQKYSYYVRGETNIKQIGVVTNPIEHIQQYLFNGYLSSGGSFYKNWFLINTILPTEEPDNNIEVDTESRTLRIYKEMYKDTTIIETSWVLGYSVYPFWIVAFWVTVSFMIFSIIRKRDLKQTAFVSLGVVSMFVPYIFVAMNRSIHPYYFIYTIPFITIGVILALDAIKHDRIRIISKISLLIFASILFAVSYPLKLFL